MGGFFLQLSRVASRALSACKALGEKKKKVFSNDWALLVQRLQEIPAKTIIENKKKATSPIHLE